MAKRTAKQVGGEKIQLSILIEENKKLSEQHLQIAKEQMMLFDQFFNQTMAQHKALKVYPVKVNIAVSELNEFLKIHRN